MNHAVVIAVTGGSSETITTTTMTSNNNINNYYQWLLNLEMERNGKMSRVHWLDDPVEPNLSQIMTN